MSRSEFRWNKKRKHYAYLYKAIGEFRKNILLTSNPRVYKKKNGKIKVVLNNVKLFAHPNPKRENVGSSNNEFYVIPKNYIDHIASFDDHVYKEWNFSINDKRKIKRIKKASK